jgi:hypothetical protein
MNTDMFHSHILKEGGYFSDGCSLSLYSNIAHSADRPHAQWNRGGKWQRIVVKVMTPHCAITVNCKHTETILTVQLTRNMGLASVM